MAGLAQFLGIEFDLAADGLEAMQPVLAVGVEEALLDQIIDGLGIDGDAIGVGIDLFANLFRDALGGLGPGCGQVAVPELLGHAEAHAQLKEHLGIRARLALGRHHPIPIAQLALIGTARISDQRLAFEVGRRR